MPSHKEFYDALNNISVNADTLNLNTDQVESKLDTATGLLTTLSADTAIIKADMANGVSVNGSVTANTGLTQPLTDTQLRATAVPVSLASAPVTPVSDNGGSLTVDGSITAMQSTAASLKAQAQLLNSAGTVVDYAMTGSAGTPATDVVSVQGIAGATAIPVSGTVNTYPAQGTTVSNSNFTSITSATLASAVASREVLTVHNEGAGMLYINVGSSVSTTSYQVRLLAGDYWEAPAGQQSLQHSGIFSSAGSTARVTEVS